MFFLVLCLKKHAITSNFYPKKKYSSKTEPQRAFNQNRIKVRQKKSDLLVWHWHCQEAPFSHCCPPPSSSWEQQPSVCHRSCRRQTWRTGDGSFHGRNSSGRTHGQARLPHRRHWSSSSQNLSALCFNSPLVRMLVWHDNTDASWSANIHWYILIIYQCPVSSVRPLQIIKACEGTSIRISCFAHKFPASDNCQISLASPIHA